MPASRRDELDRLRRYTAAKRVENNAALRCVTTDGVRFSKELTLTKFVSDIDTSDEPPPSVLQIYTHCSRELTGAQVLPCLELTLHLCVREKKRVSPLLALHPANTARRGRDETT